jgi:hypothetical protein
MISYDDLVVALAAWRTRQGLPVAQVAIAAPPPPPPRPPAPAAPRAAAPRTPAPPPPPSPTPSAHDDYDDGALVEDGQYSNSGDDYVVPLGGDMVEHAGESTAIGAAPEAATEGLTKRGKRNPDW